MSKENKNQQLPLMSRDYLKGFVRDLRENRVFVSAMISPAQMALPPAARCAQLADVREQLGAQRRVGE